jgi:hypothetical protein
VTDPAIIDIEASGLHSDSYPIEVAVHVDGVMHVWLIKPLPEWQYWDEIAEELHGLSREHLSRVGVPAAVVAAELNRVLAPHGGVVYSDAAPWDGDWLGRLYDSTGVPHEVQVRPIEDLLGPGGADRFEEARANLALASAQPLHRAAPDVELIRAAFQRAKSER